MSWVFCVSGAAIMKAGVYVNSDLKVSGAALAAFSDEVENSINARTRKDWITDYATIGTNFKGILTDLASDMIAVKMITYDMSGYTSRYEAQTMLDVLSDNINQNMNVLKDEKNKEVIFT